MSDPAKTPEEIEDVLASIRRLVSDNSSEAVEAETQRPAAVVDDRLVLTPSFRVTDPEDPWVPVFSAQTSGHTADSITTDHAGWQPDDRLAHFDAVGETDAPEEQPMEPSEADLADLLNLDGVADEPAEFESETGDDNWPSSGAESALLTLVARREPVVVVDPETGEEEDTATSVHLVAVEEDDVEADMSEADDAAELADADDALSDAEEQAFEQASDDESMSEADADPQFTSEEETPPQDNETDNLAVEEDVTPEIEPSRNTDVEETDQEPSVAPIFAGRATPEDDVEDLGEEPTPFNFPEGEDGIMDEETLREIIVDVVREELQGVLGQRITRNVRKMVRREVRLALAAEDLE